MPNIRYRSVVATCVAVWVLLPSPLLADGISPVGYSVCHPRLAFTSAEIPSLRQKVHDGGHDDEAYAFIRDLVLNDYPSSSLAEVMGVTFGMNFLLNLGIVAQLDESEGAAARELGRAFTLALVDSFAADDNTFFAPVRLRALCYGYDMCLDGATPDERQSVRREIEAYVDSMMVAFNYERWLHPPYTSNITAMIGSSLGLAAICLAGEMDRPRVDHALARADTFVATWLRHQVDPEGAAFEGVQYGTWAMRHLPWYFEARRRFDGYDYSQVDAIRKMERWLAYEILPEPGARVNNLNDTAYLNQPVSRHNSYVDWALARWSSGLSAWTWERVLGDEDGYDWGALADQPAIALWYRPIPPVQPSDVLPPAFLWRARGLYYYRSGWPRAGGSDDVVFSFYSGPYVGGHSQEDQNGFTLYSHGTRLAADNGFDSPNAQSEAHNLVFVDGRGQHHSGGSVGTDGRMAAHVLSDYADYLFGDATDAYTTYSDLNRAGFPFPDDDWSYGYVGANPVERAYREWIVVHAGETPAYFVLLDEVKKDDAVRTYDWRMHTEVDHGVDASANPLRITGTRARLEIDVCYPALQDVAVSTMPFANASVDPDTRVLVMSQNADRGAFALVLRPHGVGSISPATTSTHEAWGGVTAISWPNGVSDVVVANLDGAAVAVPGTSVVTDARLAQIRRRDGTVRAYALANVTTADVGSIPLARVDDGPARIVFDGRVVHIDRDDASCTLWAPNAEAVLVDGEPVAFVRDGAYVRVGAAAVGVASSTPRLSVFPQPARGTATIVVDVPHPGSLTVDVFDVAGRRVRRLWQGPVVAGRTHLTWDGRDKKSRASSSGVYFVRAQGIGATATAKVVVVR